MTLFNEIKGQDQAVDILSRSVLENKVASAYLFHGSDGVGKFMTALTLAMAVNCLAEEKERPCGECISCVKTAKFMHPDLLYVFPTPNYDISPEGEIKDKKMLGEYENYLNNKRLTPWKEFSFSGNTSIRVDNIRLIQHRINLSTNEGRYRVFIIEKADQMNNSAANAFLKTLEEPPNDVLIILTSSKPEVLLPTIHSRCQKIAFYKLQRQLIENLLQEEQGISLISAKASARIADGNLEKAIAIADDDDTEVRSRAFQFVNLSSQGDDYGFIGFIDSYKTSKTLSELKEIIRNLTIWLSDIVFFLNCPDEIINIDHLEFLEELSQKRSDIELKVPQEIVYLDEMLKKLEGNVNPHLVGIEIYFRLKSLLN